MKKNKNRKKATIKFFVQKQFIESPVVGRSMYYKRENLILDLFTTE
jgi:hypothetical protein